MKQDIHPVVAVVQARMTSTRLPGKVLMPLAGKPILHRVLERVAMIRGVDKLVVAVPVGSEHEPIVAAADEFGAIVSRGPEDDVLKRTAIAAHENEAATILRITSDCPMIDPDVSSTLLAAYLNMVDSIVYARTPMDRGFPLGFDTEAMSAQALYIADEKAEDPYEREHVTPYLWRRPEEFPSIILEHAPDLRHWRLVVDTAEDYELAVAVHDAIYSQNSIFGFDDLRELFSARPELLEINKHVLQTPYVGAPT